MTPVPKAPSQARGRATLARIVEAAEVLLGEEGVEATTVTAVMAAAGVGPGSFYARFEGRQALLAHVRERFWEGTGRQVSRLVADPRWSGAPIAHVVSEIVRRLVRGHTAREASLRASMVFALHEPAGDAMLKLLESDAQVQEAWERLLAAPGRSEVSIQAALHQLMSAVRCLVLFPDGEPFSAEVSEEDVILTLARAALTTMRIDEPPSDYRELLKNSAQLYGGIA